MISGLLLAAGSGARFGADKLLVPLDGEALVLAGARHLHAATDHALAVVRAGAADLGRLLREAGCEVLESEAACAGMGASLAAGVRATSHATGWIVALGDMPRVRVETIKAVADALRAGAALAAPFHAGRRGHPVGFAACWFDALAGLGGDSGARGLLQVHDDVLERIEVDDAGVLVDIDTVEDLARLGRFDAISVLR